MAIGSPGRMAFPYLFPLPVFGGRIPYTVLPNTVIYGVLPPYKDNFEGAYCLSYNSARRIHFPA